MDPDELARWRAADALFEQLLALPEDARETQLLAQATDAALRERVRRLLAAHATEGGLLDHPEALPLPPATPDAFAGRRLGRWQLGHEIGRGGMAVVYRAQSVEGPAGQDAALKILTLGSLAESGRERFLREQDALLRLGHPYIAALYDAGVADDGTPWLAMARVEGERIDDWCESRNLDTAARVRLVLQVCEAVAHAHRGLVIHRDIKPGNVLVDGDGHVRLLDFGIARLADAGDEQRTRTALRALTPEYAAPEQFEGAPAATTMDVYGIGALLYRLLSGVSSCSGATPTRDATTPPPSRALRLRGDLGDDERRRRARALRGDLDAIVMKALAPEPAARYASVDALDDDLRRWLDGRPVRAQPPGLRYRFGKFVARHRLGAAAVAALLVVVAGGIAATLWQARQAQRQAARALAVKEFLVEILESADPTRTGGKDPPASELLRRGAERIDAGLGGRPELHAELLLLIGRGQLAHGSIDEAARSLDKALALFRDGTVADTAAHAATLSERAMVAYEQGTLSEAVRMLRQADALLQARYGDDGGAYPPQREHVRARLADLLVVALHRTDEGAAIARDLADRMRGAGREHAVEYSHALRSLGAAADLEGRHEEAIGWLRQAARGVRDDPARVADLANIENELGIAYLGAGRADDAERSLARALALQRQVFGDRHPTTLATRGNLAVLQLRNHKPAQALAEYERMLPLQRALVGEEPHPDVAATWGWLALARYRLGRLQAAREAAETGWRMSERLSTDDRANVAWLAPLAGLLRLETQSTGAHALLARSGYACDSLDALSPLGRWSCLARTWSSADARCEIPTASPPPSPDGLDGLERRWWAAWWALQAECGDAAARERVVRAIGALAADTAPPFPAWFTRHLSDAGLLAAE